MPPIKGEVLNEVDTPELNSIVPVVEFGLTVAVKVIVDPTQAGLGAEVRVIV